MKRFLDELFYNQLINGNYIIAADMGFFPKSRTHKNFIDVGNNESCVGSIVEGLISEGKNVFIYDVCGYIIKNSYSSLYARNNSFHKIKGHLTIFGWGSGFSYDECLLGHYPLDDIMIAHLLGLTVINPYDINSFKSIKYNETDLYVRLFDLKQYPYKNKPYNLDSELYLVSYGWILSVLQKYAINNFWKNKKISIIPYVNELEKKIDITKVFYYSDNIYEPNIMKFIHTFHPMNVNKFPELSKKYVDKKSCIKYWFNLE